MKFFEIEYRLYSCEDTGVIVVSANISEEAIEKAGLQDAYEYSIKEYIPYKLGNKSYSPRLGTYNAMWLDNGGNPAYWGNYNPDDAVIIYPPQKAHCQVGCGLSGGIEIMSLKN